MIDHLSDATEGQAAGFADGKGPAALPAGPACHHNKLSPIGSRHSLRTAGVSQVFRPPKQENPDSPPRPDVKLPRVCKNHLGRARPLIL